MDINGQVGVENSYRACLDPGIWNWSSESHAESGEDGGEDGEFHVGYIDVEVDIDGLG